MTLFQEQQKIESIKYRPGADIELADGVHWA